jgi:hypothetical protein
MRVKCGFKPVISRGLTAIFFSATISLGAVLPSAASEQTKPPRETLERPSVKLVLAGLSYIAPKSWTQEDYPQLNGVLILAPAQIDASGAKPKQKQDQTKSKQWRSRILVELAKTNDAQFDELALTEATIYATASKVPLPSQHTVVSKNWINHPRGFSYAIAEIEVERQGERVREYRLVMNSAQTGQRIIVTASAQKAQWLVDKPVFDAFIASIGVRN